MRWENIFSFPLGILFILWWRGLQKIKTEITKSFFVMFICPPKWIRKYDWHLAAQQCCPSLPSSGTGTLSYIHNVLVMINTIQIKLSHNNFSLKNDENIPVLHILEYPNKNEMETSKCFKYTSNYAEVVSRKTLVSGLFSYARTLLMDA